MVHWYRNVLSVVPKGKSKEVAAMLKASHAQEDYEAAQAKTEDVRQKLESMTLAQAAKLVGKSAHKTLTYMYFPREHWRRIRTNNPLERVMKEIRRRTKVVGAFPDGQSAMMLCAARLRHVAGTKSGTRRYLDLSRLRELDAEQAEAAAPAGYAAAGERTTNRADSASAFKRRPSQPFKM